MELQELDRKGSTHLEEKRLGGNVDLGLLLQSSKDQRVWVEGLGDLVVLSFATMEEREKRAQEDWGTVGEESPLNRFPQKGAVGCSSPSQR